MRIDDCKTSLLILALFFQLGFYCGCKKHPPKKISDKELSVITASCHQRSYPISLYYLDGNCSFCLAKAKDFDDKKMNNGGKSIIIFMTSNPIMTKLYIQEIMLRSCIILDSSNAFAKSFSLNSRYEISEKGEILSESADK